MSGGRIDRAAGMILGPFLDGLTGLIRRATLALRARSDRRIAEEEAARSLVDDGTFQVISSDGLLLWETDDLDDACEYSDKLHRQGTAAVVVPKVARALRCQCKVPQYNGTPTCLLCGRPHQPDVLS